MGDISNGPVSSLPGHIKSAPLNAKCDEHPERDSFRRVQGETDSFGCEYLDMCQECYTAYIEEAKSADYSGRCDWCKKDTDHLYPHRDIEEGSSSRVYEVCRPCINKERQSWQDEDDYYA